ncbi:CpsB/CapC family capsule biosynthesis tyrosine phosphatase [Anaerocolumna xylanovorans]|uniref:protein-tyrosine-phosphatase n=1 Tax=Anaerocolumna xylanovorans DSM 12503 TaxID=1121345 RepID=A0A1M7YAD3_9FIRM|nr:CpsB/CapC family capsule biosynthesis tyrosine phosphatase [Anaerocolumna xylanovorans]SHO49559.1 protein-tyrosine phosphatase [Anaerocolumna xylanovorans DSM 12503]
MEGYIDIHSHIIPGVDDGARNMEEALLMLAAAYREGIRSIIATPHVSYRRDEDRYRKLESAFLELKERAEKEIPELKLYLGSEINYSQDTVYGLCKKEIPTLAGTSYILVEFQPFCEYRYIKGGIQSLIMGGYKPVIAHVERYHRLRGEVEMFEELISMGAYLQSNAMSITGGAGRESKKLTKRLLQKGLLHFIATDSHNVLSRPPDIAKCLTATARKYGEKYAKELSMHNADKLLRDRYI